MHEVHEVQYMELVYTQHKKQQHPTCVPRDLLLNPYADKFCYADECDFHKICVVISKTIPLHKKAVYY